MLKEFKDFISKGNVLDLAVGVIIGLAFGAIVNSIVADFLMPLIGIVLGGIDFSGLSVVIGSATLPYGKLIQSVVNFLIISFVLFLMVKAMSNFKTKKEDVPVPPTREEELLIEIRDLLKANSTR